MAAEAAGRGRDGCQSRPCSQCPGGVRAGWRHRPRTGWDRPCTPQGTSSATPWAREHPLPAPGLGRGQRGAQGRAPPQCWPAPGGAGVAGASRLWPPWVSSGGGSRHSGQSPVAQAPVGRADTRPVPTLGLCVALCPVLRAEWESLVGQLCFPRALGTAACSAAPTAL